MILNEFLERIDTDEYYISPSQKRWLRLCKLAPKLRHLRNVEDGHEPSPRQMTDALLLSIAAAFADPTRREILRALIFDLLMDDIIDLLTSSDKEEPL